MFVMMASGRKTWEKDNEKQSLPSATLPHTYVYI